MCCFVLKSIKTSLILGKKIRLFQKTIQFVTDLKQFCNMLFISVLHSYVKIYLSLSRMLNFLNKLNHTAAVAGGSKFE